MGSERAVGIVKSCLPATGDHGCHRQLSHSQHGRGVSPVTKFSIQETKTHLHFSCELQTFKVPRREKAFPREPGAPLS